MRPEEIRELGEAELEQKLEELADELFQLRLRGTYEELENPMKIRQVRRDIAKVKTVIGERQLAAARAAKEK
ncbi:MAG: 50S ribosomal protein L29 [Gemmatimonadota bacterium]|nr:MAG: 50S ribosomal protein L29 [Gemmatimonadota bacterium]